METATVNSKKFTKILSVEGLHLYPEVNFIPLITDCKIYQMNPEMIMIVHKDASHRIQPGEPYETYL